jgi:hypothetical protein
VVSGGGGCGHAKAFELALISRFAPGTSRFTADPLVLEELKQVRVFALAKRQRCNYGFRLMRRSSSADARFFLLSAWWNGTTTAA